MPYGFVDVRNFTPAANQWTTLGNVTGAVRLRDALWSAVAIAIAFGSAPMAAAPARAPASVIWQTAGSVTFATADGGDVCLIDASGGLGNPKASLVKIGSSGASRVATFSGYAYWPTADKDAVYLVVDKDVVRVDKRSPHAMKVLAKGELWPIGTAVDGENVYFTNQSTEGLTGGPPDGKPGSVARVKKTGGAVERLSAGNARNLVLDADNVYFSSGTSVRAVSKHGGPDRILADDVGHDAFLAIDGEWLVYTRSNGVSRVNTKSGKIEPLADDIDIPLFVAAADGTTYLGANMAFQGVGKEPTPAQILRLRPGSAPEQLWSGRSRLTTMVLAKGKLYFTIEGFGETKGAKLLRIDPSKPKP